MRVTSRHLNASDDGKVSFTLFFSADNVLTLAVVANSSPTKSPHQVSEAEALVRATVRTNKKREKRKQKRAVGSGTYNPGNRSLAHTHIASLLDAGDTAAGISDLGWTSAEDSVVQQCRKVSANAKRSSRSPDRSSQVDEEEIDVDVDSNFESDDDASDEEEESRAQTSAKAGGSRKRKAGGKEGQPAEKKPSKIKSCKFANWSRKSRRLIQVP